MGGAIMWGHAHMDLYARQQWQVHAGPCSNARHSAQVPDQSAALNGGVPFMWRAECLAASDGVKLVHIAGSMLFMHMQVEQEQPQVKSLSRLVESWLGQRRSLCEGHIMHMPKTYTCVTVCTSAVCVPQQGFAGVQH